MAADNFDYEESARLAASSGSEMALIALAIWDLANQQRRLVDAVDHAGMNIFNAPGHPGALEMIGMQLKEIAGSMNHEAIACALNDIAGNMSQPK